MGDVNLIPARRLARKRWRRRGRVWAGLCGTYLLLLAGGLLLAHVLWHSDSSALDRERQFLDQAIEGHNLRALELRGQLVKVTRELEVSQAIGGQPDWSKLLVLLGRELGDEVVLSRCGLATTDGRGGDITSDVKAWLASSPLEVLLASRRYRLELAGFGRTQRSVSQFVLGLEKTAMFESVRLINSYRQAFLDGQAIAFSIECRI
jgi:hypothetical protein